METSLHNARLVVHDGDDSRTVPIETLPFTIGRQNDRNLVFTNAQVSRQHLSIHHDDEGFFLQDLGSRQGTLLNGERKDTARLHPGDRIQLGDSGIVLVFLLSSDHHSTTRALLSRISAPPGGT